MLLLRVTLGLCASSSLLTTGPFLPRAGAASPQDAPPRKVQVAIPVRHDWIRASFEESTAERAASATRVARVLDPAGVPYVSDAALEQRGLDRVLRTFRLHSARCLLGEPLAVEYRVSVEGEGLWSETVGGNYRGRGRDDNFLLLMQHEDGTWVEDPYGPDPVFASGGLSVDRPASAEEPLIRWVPVQRWCALERPGRYILHCLRKTSFSEALGGREAVRAQVPAELLASYDLDERGLPIDPRTGRPARDFSIERRMEWKQRAPSPVFLGLPDPLRERLGPEEREGLVAWASFTLELVAGSPEEQAAMLVRSREQMAGGNAVSIDSARADALYTAAMFCRQDSFLPLLAQAGESDADLRHGLLRQALAQHPSDAALDLLFSWGEQSLDEDRRLINDLRMLHPHHRRRVIPRLIEWLTSEDPSVRTRSELRLHEWTGESFGRDWKGYRSGRPTFEEGRTMQAAWREWWSQREGRSPERPLR